MIEQYLVGAAVGSVLAAAFVSRWQKARCSLGIARARGEFEACRESLVMEAAGHRQEIDEGNAAAAQREAEYGRVLDDLRGQADGIARLRTALDAASEAQRGCAHEAQRIAEEAARLKGLAATFERWHEQMNSLMAQNPTCMQRTRSWPPSSSTW